MSTQTARDAVLRTFRWQSGHADVWRVFADANAFKAVVDGLVEPWRGSGVTAVLGIESRRFLLGGVVARMLGVGFVAVRKSDGLLPGARLSAVAAEDYRGRRHTLRMQPVLTQADRVLLVDDWAERGSQGRAARELVEAGGASFLGMSVMVDQLDDAVRTALGRVTSVVTAEELGPSE